MFKLFVVGTSCNSVHHYSSVSILNSNLISMHDIVQLCFLLDPSKLLIQLIDFTGPLLVQTL